MCFGKQHGQRQALADIRRLNVKQAATQVHQITQCFHCCCCCNLLFFPPMSIFLFTYIISEYINTFLNFQGLSCNSDSTGYVITCLCGCDSPVELINVLYVSKQGTHLLGPYGKITHIYNVGQIVLEKSREQRLNGTVNINTWRHTSSYKFLPVEGAHVQINIFNHHLHFAVCFSRHFRFDPLSPTLLAEQRIKYAIYCADTDVLHL